MSELDKKVRVLVTGGTGLVGKGIEWNQKNAPKYTDAEFIFLSSADADLRDLASTMACFEKHKPTHVIHLAAIVVSAMDFFLGILSFAR
jgi:GDP-L-fucose synthase